MTQDEAFKAWWYNEGSQAPYTHHDCEEHTMRMCEIAWVNGAYKERESILKMLGDALRAGRFINFTFVSKAIKARGQA
jgi:hypothetical protein